MNHLTAEQIQKYQHRELSSNEIVSVINHLRECDVCREQTMKTVQFQKSISSLQLQFADEAHPSYEELSGYVDSKIDSEKISAIKEHASECEICRLQIEDLKKLQNELKVVQFQPAKSGRQLRNYLLAAIIALVALMAAWLIGDLFEKDEPQIVKKPADSIQLVDGGRTIEISKNGKILNAPGISGQQIVQMETIIKSKKLTVSEDLQTLNPQPGTLLGDEPKKRFKLKSPVGIVVLDNRPLFQWEPLSEAFAYQVAVLDQDLQPVIISNKIKDQDWQPDPILERGKVYLWQVTAYTPDGEFTSPAPPEPEAMIKIVDEQKFQQIKKARETNSPSMILAALYAEAGLIDQARAELLNLKNENPHSQLIEDLLKSLP